MTYWKQQSVSAGRANCTSRCAACGIQ